MANPGSNLVGCDKRNSRILVGLFIIPFGVMALGYAHAYGLTIIAGFFLLPLAIRLIDKDKTDGKTAEYAVMHISACGVF